MDNQENIKDLNLQEDNKKRNNKTLIIILIIIILLLLIYIIFNNLSKKTTEDINKNQLTPSDDIQVNESTMSDDNQISDVDLPEVNNDIKIVINMDDDIKKEPLITYTKEEVEIIKYDYTTEYNHITDETSLVKTDYGLYAKYIIFKGGDKSINELNDKMLKKVNEIIDNHKKFGEKITKEEMIDGVYMKVQDDGTIINYTVFNTIEYKIIEYKKYYLLLEIDSGGEYRGTGAGSLTNCYPIDKYTGKIVSNDEIINSIEHIEELKKRLINDASKKFDSEYISYFEPRYKKEYISELTNKLNNNDFIVSFSDYGRLIFKFKNLPEHYEISYEYSTEYGEWSDILFW